MPPYCEEHARYHADPEQCHRMREAARRLAADKARAKINREKAERIAAEQLEIDYSAAQRTWDYLPNEMRRDDLKTALTMAVLAGMENAS